jgi:alkylated DNA repair dioxygenase AlkB
MIADDGSPSLKFWPYFLTPLESAALLQALLTETPWRQLEMQMYGRRVKTPRLTCWYGDAGAVYTYSGIRNEPLPWTPSLSSLREGVQRASGAAFNSVLLNLYRDGRDSMSWHSDDEPELGANPIIASVSLGAQRRFDFRRARVEKGARRETRSIELTDGSLLLMSGNTQGDWQHSVPKAARVNGRRINLTFRRVDFAPTHPP